VTNRFSSLGLAGFALAACAAALPAAANDEPIATDRPDFVESSDVVGKHRLQIESSIALDRDSSAGGRQTLRSTPTLIRFGISDTLELRVESDGVLRQRSATGRESGVADTSLGLKWHALDAAGGMPSVGVLLHADLSSGSAAFREEGTRPSARVVAEWELPHEMSLGMMPGIAYEKSHGGRVYGIFGLVLGKSLSERLRTFVEVSSPHIARAAHGGTEAVVTAGAAYLLRKNLQIDTALSRGLNSRTPDHSLTIGLSIKL
jgi:hypothetical protein